MFKDFPNYVSQFLLGKSFSNTLQPYFNPWNKVFGNLLTILKNKKENMSDVIYASQIEHGQRDSASYVVIYITQYMDMILIRKSDK